MHPATAPLEPREVRVVLAGGPGVGALQAVAEGLEPLLTHGEKARAARFLRLEDAWCNVVGRGLFRSLAGSLAGVDPAGVRVEAGPHGKPFLPDHPHLHMNVAHSGGLVVLTATTLGPVGVDIERLAPDRATGEIARRFFAPEEWQELERLPGEARAHAFFETWTRKEAFLKATGLGIARGLDSFAVAVGAPAALRRVDHGPPPPHWWMADLEVPHGWKGALALERRRDPAGGGGAGETRDPGVHGGGEGGGETPEALPDPVLRLHRWR